ncbi:alpha/beta hydrolase [Methylonatrum kenyense]|uniref:alpha/beta fold hydrolase n=1 Tax=Methylonatrum kenyense TaxID=455253 RepID=UPI0020BE0125|nr:alpha/beta hydrolase [Methylonatrum kenyense]MCK8516689.1 alpha/beta hydrolase [Methylonatrum kenyense]
MQTRTLTLNNGMPLQFDHAPRETGLPTLVLIHGWTCRRSYWKPQVEHLNDRYPLLVPDLPGHGDSPAWQETPASIDGLADCLVELITHQVTGPAILLGHSMGGAVALKAAQQLGNVARGVILADTFVIDYGGLDAETQDTLYQTFADDFSGGMHWLIDNTSVEQTPESLRNRLKQEMAEADPAWALPLWKTLLAWQPDETFPAVRCPIRAINGKLVPMTARKRCKPFLNEVVMPRAGHFLQMEDPIGFNRLLDEALADLT